MLYSESEESQLRILQRKKERENKASFMEHRKWILESIKEREREKRMKKEKRQIMRVALIDLLIIFSLSDYTLSCVCTSLMKWMKKNN